MGYEYPDIMSLLGYDDEDVLGLDRYLEEQKRKKISYLPRSEEFISRTSGEPPLFSTTAPTSISAAPEPSLFDRAQDWVSELFGMDSDEVASRNAIQTVERREQLAREQEEFEKERALHGLFGAPIPGAHPEVPTPLDAMAGIAMSMPGGLGQGAFESGKAVKEQRGERADFLRGPRGRISEDVTELEPTALPRVSQPPKDVRDFLYETNERYRDLTDQLSAFDRDRAGWGGLPKGFEELLKRQEISVKDELGKIETDALNVPPSAENLPPSEPVMPGTTGGTFLSPSELATRDVRGFTEAALRQLQERLSGPAGEIGVFPDEGTRSDFMAAKLVPENPVTKGVLADFYSTAGLSDSMATIDMSKSAFPIKPYLEKVGQLRMDPRVIRAHSRNPIDFVHNLVSTLAHEAGGHSRAGKHSSVEAWRQREIEPGRVGDVPPEVASEYQNEFAIQDQISTMREHLYQLPVIQNLLETANVPGSPIYKAFYGLTSLPMNVRPESFGMQGLKKYLKDPTKVQQSEEVTIPTGTLPVEGYPETVDLSNFGPQGLPGKSEQVTTPTGNFEPQGLPSKSEQVVSAPANILRKILQETKTTRFNEKTLVEELKNKGVEVPPEVMEALPELIGELKDRGWLQAKIGGTYSLLAGPPRTMTGISKGKPVETTSVVDQMTKTLEGMGAEPGTPTKTGETPTVPVEPTKPAASPKKKVVLTPEEEAEVRRIFGTVVGKKKGKEVPEEVRLAQEAASKGKGEEIKEPPPSEEVAEEGEGKPVNYKITLSSGEEVTVKATSEENARAKADEVLAEYGSTKTVDKVEEELSPLERAAKYEIEPTRQGAEQVTEGLKAAETERVGIERAQASEVKKQLKVEEAFAAATEKQETTEFAGQVRETERLRKAQAKEKLAKKSFVVTLSNGEKVTVKARNEESAKKHAESKIKEAKSGVSVASVVRAKTPLEKAISGKEPKPVEKLEKGLIDDITDIPKTLKSSFDISWPGRQGLFLLNRPAAIKGMLKGTASGIPFKTDEMHQNVLNDLQNRPNAKAYEKFGLNQVKWEPGDIAARSEQFASEVASELPGIKHSERMFNDAGNLARANMFDYFDAQFRRNGKTPETNPELYKSMADYLNVLTMRKPLPEKLRQAGWLLNKAFFSPMALYSRLEMANPFWYAKLPTEMKKAALRDIGGTLGSIVGMLGAIKFAASQAGMDSDDIDVSFDPAHTHFARLKVKETYYDLPGLTPILRTYYRMISGRKKTPVGEYRLPGGMFSRFQENLPNAPFGQSAFGEAAGFFENKASPAYQAVKGAAKGKGFGGKDYGLSPLLSDLFAPMSIEQMTEAGIEYGPGAAARQLPNFFGISTFTPPKRKFEDEFGEEYQEFSPNW